MVIGYILYVLYGPTSEPEIIVDDIITYEQCLEMKAIREAGATTEYPKFNCGMLIQ